MAQLPVFVYGTLRHGQVNHPRYLAGRYRELFPAVAARHTMYAQDVPVVCDGAGSVVGEIVFLQPGRYRETLRELDLLEGTAEAGGLGLYRRVVREVLADRPEGTETLRAWIYHATRTTLLRFTESNRLRSGDWLAP
jgi:gamma-glutamylcyclotransferase (GGCT)/AIG2-like uncharacterized protein YtfP